MTTKEQLHRLVDSLPDSEVEEAALLLERLAQRSQDPLLRALANAPDDDEPETEEERLAVEEAHADVANGQWSPWEDVERRLFGRR